nr:MAG TPA: hypothetical protein [Caudoviricetes sp.]
MFNGHHIVLEKILRIKYCFEKKMRCNTDL